MFGMNMPIYLLGRFEFGRRGAVQFGGGPFTTFVFRGMMYVDSSLEKTDPFRRVYSADELTGEEQMLLSDNYSGLGVTLGYEFWFGLQINLGYQCAISDILNYPHIGSYALPQKGYLGIAYRFLLPSSTETKRPEIRWFLSLGTEFVGIEGYERP